MTAQIIGRNSIFVALLLSNGFYGVGLFNDETHQIEKLYHDNLTTEKLAIDICLVFHVLCKIDGKPQ